MSRKQFMIEQIITKLREAEVSLSKGATMAVVCRSLGVTEQTYYRWHMASPTHDSEQAVVYRGHWESLCRSGLKGAGRSKIDKTLRFQFTLGTLKGGTR